MAMGTAPDRTQLRGMARSALRQGNGREGLQALARAGLVARGLVYGVIGVLALKLALGAGGKTAGETDGQRDQQHLAQRL